MVQALRTSGKQAATPCAYTWAIWPEISETLLAKHFDGPKMFVAAAEESRG